MQLANQLSTTRQFKPISFLAAPEGNPLPVMPLRAHRPKQTHVTNLVLADLNPEHTELLLGALGFLAGSRPTWISWVNPPYWAQQGLREKAPTAMQIRLLYQDTQHSAFHLLYKTMQAGNNAWVVANAAEISVREREILEQAAEHHDCRLLLVSQRNHHR